MSAAAHIYAHGTAVTIAYRAPYRVDRYMPNDGRPAVEELHFADGPGDTSPIHRTYPTGYDARCASCWLGHSHTTARHARSIGGAP